MDDGGQPRVDGRRVLLFLEDGFAAREVIDVRQRLVDAGADVVTVGPSTKAPFRDKSGTVEVMAEMTASAARTTPFDAIVIPGGHAPDRMRMRHAMLDLVAEAIAKGKIVGAICHGPQVLISADVLRGRTLTCWPSIAVDVKNAGGRYVDRPAVNDGGVITARKGDDVPYFVDAIIEALSLNPAS